jgi:hypothetical protein
MPNLEPGYALENESPARRSAGGCRGVVGARGPRLPEPELGRTWAQPERSPGGLVGGAPGPRRGEAGGGGQPRGYFLSPSP